MPNISFSPYIAFNSQEFDNINRDFNSSGFESEIKFNITPQFFTQVKYNYSEIDGDKALSKLDFELRFTNKIKSLDASIVGINAFAQDFNNNIFQSPLFRTEASTIIFGRRILLKLSYNF